jgi:hypothetical protein
MAVRMVLQDDEERMASGRGAAEQGKILTGHREVEEKQATSRLRNPGGAGVFLV